MDQEKFWALIQLAIDSEPTSKEDYLAILGNELAQLSLEEIAHWDSFFDAYMQLADKEKIWAGGFILNKGDCDDDEFAYFRAWLISMGKAYYLQVLENVDILADLAVADPVTYVAKFEGLVYLAGETFVNKAKYQPLSSLEKAEQLYFRYIDTFSLDSHELFLLKREIEYDRDVNFVWDEKDERRLKLKLPRLSKKYFEYLDKNALKYQPDTELLFVEDE